MKKILIVGDGNSPIISENYISYLANLNGYDFDILSFKKIKNNRFKKIYNLSEIKNNYFSKLNSIRFLIMFLFSGLRIIKKYDIIHFHMFYYGIFFLTPFFRENVVLTLWGSDFLKANWIKRYFLGKTLKKVKIVTCTNLGFSKEIIEYYPFCESKMVVLPYMVKYVELVNKFYNTRKKSKKIRIVVGSNSNYSQNHLEMLNAIKESNLDVNYLHPN